MNLNIERDIPRRRLLTGTAGLIGLAVTGCSTTDVLQETPEPVEKDKIPPNYAAAYGPMPQERFPIPAVNLNKVPRRFWRQQIEYTASYLSLIHI